MPTPNRLSELAHALAAADGVASSADLVANSTRGTFRRAGADGLIVPAGHGVWTTPQIMQVKASAAGGDSLRRAWSTWTEPPSATYQLRLRRDLAIATAKSAALSHRSAARHHDWPILVEPDGVEIVVPHSRNVRRPASAAGMRTRWRALDADELSAGVTSPLRTVLDCARDLPFLEALAIADSALRSKAVGRETLINAADVYRGHRAGEVRRIAALAHELPENPFESALRGVLGNIDGLTLVPQYPVRDGTFQARLDLADPHRGIAFEADGYEFHGSAEQFAADCERTIELMARGWIVFRVTWHLVMRRAGWLRSRAAEVVDRRPLGFTTSTNHSG